MQFAIRDLPYEERPLERCLAHGPSCLSLRECLAILLGSGPVGVGCLGVADRILSRCAAGLEDPREIERAFFTAAETASLGEGGPWGELGGLGPVGRARLLASLEISRRYLTHRSRQAGDPGCSPDSRGLNRIPTRMRNETREWLGFIPIHRQGGFGALCVVERGARTHVNVDPAELFARILVLRPRAIILVHNHPSDDPSPSSEDRELTYRVAEVADQLGLRLLGHWIVGPSREHWLEVERV